MCNFQHGAYEELSATDYKENDSSSLKRFVEEEYTADDEF